MRCLGQLDQMEVVAVALEPGDVVGNLLRRGHALEPEQLVELDAGLDLVLGYFEGDVLDQVLCWPFLR
jgi:hypothetical protein